MSCGHRRLSSVSEAMTLTRAESRLADVPEAQQEAAHLMRKQHIVAALRGLDAIALADRGGTTPEGGVI